MDAKNIPQATSILPCACGGKNCEALHLVLYDVAGIPMAQATVSLEMALGYVRQITEIIAGRAEATNRPDLKLVDPTRHN